MVVAKDIGELDQALAEIVERVAELVEADLVVARVADESGSGLVARAVHASSASLRAELEGSRIGVGAAPSEDRDELSELPRQLQVAAEQLAPASVLQLPVRDGSEMVGTLELVRRRGGFDPRRRLLARAAAAEVALARRAYGEGDGARSSTTDLLALAGDALAAGSDEARGVEQLAAITAEATGAVACLVWRFAPGGPVLAAISGPDAAAAPPAVLDAVRGAQESAAPITLERLAEELPGGGVALATLRLGEPPLGALQLVLDEDPDERLISRLGTFAVRAAHALRSSERRQTLAVELERARALLTIVGQAIAELSLAHTLETAVEHVSELLDADRLAVYLLEEDGERLEPAAAQGLTGPHVRVGQRLLELVLGPSRGRGLLLIPDAAGDLRLAGVREALEEVGLEAALAVPLQVRGELIGLLGVYPRRGRTLTENEESLLLALAAQLAVAVQNARLHEKVERESDESKRARDEALEASRRLRALYDISRSFTESLSLDKTLEAVARTLVESLGIDAAALRMPDPRGEALVPVALHVHEERLAEPIGRILSLPQPISPLRPSVFRSGEPVLLDADAATALGSAHEPLIPFLEKGSTAAVIPLATQAEMLGTLTLLSLDPDRPIAGDTVDAAISIAGQAALALDNARLYQQQKDFAESMQRSLLARSSPQLEELETGVVYDSSARMEVGGDVYDFLEVSEGCLAVVLGDVTGHGIDAAADMAMAKFVFRSLAREHSQPGDFLAVANEIVLGEIGTGKFITLLYLLVDAPEGDLACASAGHPPPLLVQAGRPPEPLPVQGLALGVEPGQRYDEARVRLAAGDAVVLYTDGVLEARRGGELYGEKRLSDAVAGNAHLPAQDLAEALLDDCRAFAGELADDCALVVLKRRVRGRA